MTTTHDLIAAATSMDAVSLLVADLDGMTAYYRDVIALDVLDTVAPSEQPGAARLRSSKGRPASDPVHSPPSAAGVNRAQILVPAWSSGWE